MCGRSWARWRRSLCLWISCYPQASTSRWTSPERPPSNTSNWCVCVCVSVCVCVCVCVCVSRTHDTNTQCGVCACVLMSVCCCVCVWVRCVCETVNKGVLVCVCV